MVSSGQRGLSLTNSNSGIKTLALSDFKTSLQRERERERERESKRESERERVKEGE
jgi:hypothetical protein